MQGEIPPLAPESLWVALAQGATLLTPNRRLAQAVQQDFEARQPRDRLAWATPDVLPFDAFVRRFWEDALYSLPAGRVPLLLSAAQEQALWEEAIAGSRQGGVLASPAAAAAQCRRAWALAHAWQLAEQLPRQDGGEDARAFNEWAARYSRSTRERGLTDEARLPGIVAPLFGEDAVHVPARLILHGFDVLTPQQRDLVAALHARGCEVHEAPLARRGAVTARREFASVQEEWGEIACWARTRLEENPAARIGIVVPDLPQSRARVSRALARVLRPAYLAEGGNLPFDVSLGLGLDRYPLVADALAILRLCGREVEFEEASRIARSAFVAGGQSEASERARADVAMRERAALTVSLEGLVRLAAAGQGPAPRVLLDRLSDLAAGDEGGARDAAMRERAALTVSLEGLVRLAAAGQGPAPRMLLDRLSDLATFRRERLFGARPAGEWAQAFFEALRVMGFPGERTLDSAEMQLMDKWHELLAEFSALERVTGKMKHAEACARLERMARETLFQPEAHDVPIRVLGVLESAGLAFDHLWVSGLSDEAWPMPARPHPFLPVALQRRAGIPHSDAQLSLELDRRLTAGWLGAAGEVVVSHARMQQESELAASPLVREVPLVSREALGIRAFPTLRDAMRRRGELERIPDTHGSALEVVVRTGGTGLFKDQAACPFRAFAQHRLGARELASPQPGLAPHERGTLLHEMLRATWQAIGSRARLVALAADEKTALLEAAAEEAIGVLRRRRAEVLSGRFARMEQRRLVAIAGEWLAHEATRPDFEMVAVERKTPVTFGGITVHARIDREDRLAQGGRVIIDYKTGKAKATPAAWLGARPDDPQLPMYALASGEDVRAIAFAQVLPGNTQFCGLAMEEGLLPKVGTVDKVRAKVPVPRDWASLTAQWRREIEGLAAEFRAGDARVSPKAGAKTCELCAQKPFCRIAAAERAVEEEGVE